MQQIGLIRLFTFVIFIVGFSIGVGAQKFVQLEITNSLKTYKFTNGDRFVYKTKNYPKKWRKQKIERIDYEGNFIVFTQEIVMLDDITEVRIFNVVPAALGTLLQTFGVVSLVYGGIGDAIQGQLMPQTLIYGLGGLGLGYFLDRFVSYKRYKLGRTARLRLLDVSI